MAKWTVRPEAAGRSWAVISLECSSVRYGGLTLGQAQEVRQRLEALFCGVPRLEAA